MNTHLCSSLHSIVYGALCEMYTQYRAELASTQHQIQVVLSKFSIYSRISCRDSTARICLQPHQDCSRKLHLCAALGIMLSEI